MKMGFVFLFLYIIIGYIAIIYSFKIDAYLREKYLDQNERKFSNPFWINLKSYVNNNPYPFKSDPVLMKYIQIIKILKRVALSLLFTSILILLFTFIKNVISQLQ